MRSGTADRYGSAVASASATARRIVSGLLGMLLLTVAACGPASTSGADAPRAEAVAEGTLAAYDPVVEVRMIRDVDEDLRANILPSCPGETMEDNRWTRAFEEDLGIRLTYDWTMPAGDAYSRKLNVTLASGNLPDVMGVDAAQLKQLADADMIEDLTDVWYDTASDLLRKAYTDAGPSTLGSSTFNGRLKGILQNSNGYGEGVFVWIRSDWLRKLGLSAPETMDDILRISRAFTTEDPDGNGSPDTYGLAVSRELYFGCMGVEGFFAGYHAYPNMWIPRSDGSIVHGSIQPETKTALQALAGMYARGEIDPEFGAKETAKVAETIVSGKIGMEFGAQWNPMYPLIGSRRQDPDADWTGYALVSCDDEPALSPFRFEATRFMAVRKGYEHPEALVKMMNLVMENCWGETADFNRYYMPEENGSVGVWKFAPVYPTPPYKNLDAFAALDSARLRGKTDELTGESAVIERNIEAYMDGDESQWGWERIYGPAGVFRWGLQYISEERMLLEPFTGALTPTMVSRRTTLEKMEKEAFIRIIMGEDSVDAFDSFVEDWNRLGGKQITREVNEWRRAEDR